ncbi:MAG TPA: 3-phosphoshikimate 1-carboxyvinyltransferase [Rhizomicrobium sp.]|nr:3-phosphoshikimate 1-carboxyvinyltransferase [Rhizomicrobium sp.]
MQAPDVPRPLEARRSGALKGRVAIPGDKSISHRSLILGALAIGETKISGLLEGDDVLATAAALRQFGAEVVRDGEGEWHVHGAGVGGWSAPDDTLDFGNSGTGARLVMGAMATTDIAAAFTGDASLRNRPLRRVLEPLTDFGATYVARDGGFMPLMITGASRSICIDHEVSVPSAQVKSALLLAALNAPGRSRISQSALTRDHTERMLKAFGAEITTEVLPDGGEAITITGETELHPVPVTVPADPSSAAFPLAAALLVQGSEILLPGVLLNERRTGLLATLREMGATIAIENRGESGGEEIGDLVARASLLKGVEVPPERAPAMIDEYPMLAVLAAFAEGRTVMRGLSELRVKESDRLSGIARGLAAIGVNVQESEDGLIIEGLGPEGVRGGARIATHMDHRLAMAFLVGGFASREPISIDDSTMVRTSFPNFRRTMQTLGANISVPAR